jgi:hypothetical protein
MEGIGSVGIPELMILSCACLVPVIIVVGVVVGLLVVVGRRKPKAEPKAPAPRRAAAVATKPVAEEKPAAKPTVEEKPAPVAEPAMKSCTSCGADNPVDNAFCEYCGASLAEK